MVTDTATVKIWAMVTATRLAGDEEGNGDGDKKGNGGDDEVVGDDDWDGEEDRPIIPKRKEFVLVMVQRNMSCIRRN